MAQDQAQRGLRYSPPRPDASRCSTPYTGSTRATTMAGLLIRLGCIHAPGDVSGVPHPQEPRQCLTRFRGPPPLEPSEAESRCTQRACCSRHVLRVKALKRSASYSCAAHIRQAVLKSCRQSFEQNRCTLPPLLRDSYGLPHQVQSRLTAPLPAAGSRCRPCRAA
jgi:hypothetical protein